MKYSGYLPVRYVIALLLLTLSNLDVNAQSGNSGVRVYSNPGTANRPEGWAFLKSQPGGPRLDGPAEIDMH